MSQMNPLPSSPYDFSWICLVLSLMFILNILQILYQFSLGLFLFCIWSFRGNILAFIFTYSFRILLYSYHWTWPICVSHWSCFVSFVCTHSKYHSSKKSRSTALHCWGCKVRWSIIEEELLVGNLGRVTDVDIIKLVLHDPNFDYLEFVIAVENRCNLQASY